MGSDKYGAIALLDDDLEEKRSERTTVDYGSGPPGEIMCTYWLASIFYAIYVTLCGQWDYGMPSRITKTLPEQF